MFSPTHSNISQNDAEMLEEQQQSLLLLQEAVEACRAEHAAQKARREVEAKAKKEAERQRIAEEKKKKKRTMEYLQQLWDKVLKEEATLLEGAEGSQVTGSQGNEVATGDKERQWPSKKARGKYCGGAAVKMGGSNPCERCVCTGQDCLVHPSRCVINNYTYYYFLIIFFFIAAPLLVPDASHSSSSIYPTPIPTPRP